MVKKMISALIAVCSLAPHVSGQSGGFPAGPQANNRGTGFADVELAMPLELDWVWVDRLRPQPAWKEPMWEPQRIDFDYAYGVTADSERVYYGSSADHAIHALDLRTGAHLWRFFTQGPVRVAPTVHGGRVYASSDDGFVYCLEAESGRLLWKLRPPVPDRRMVGNEQVISRWPARSGVLIEGDIAYTTFGNMAPEGVFVYAFDAATGNLHWMNNFSGMQFGERDDAAVSPGGYLAVSDDVLFVACGRAEPAFVDRATGQLLYHRARVGIGAFTGGAWMMTHDGLTFTPRETLHKVYGHGKTGLRRPGPGPVEFLERGSLVALDSHTGTEVFTLIGGRRGVTTDDGRLTLIGPGGLTSVLLEDVRAAVGEKSRIKDTTGHFVRADEHTRWRNEAGTVYSLLQAGDVLVAGRDGSVVCYDATNGTELWQAGVEGQVRGLSLIENGFLASTTEGRIYAFRTGGLAAGGAALLEPPAADSLRDETAGEAAARVLSGSGVQEGYCLVMGGASSAFLAELALRSNLSIYYLDETGDAGRMREELHRAGLYGVHATVHEPADDCGTSYASYLADLLVFVADDAAALGTLDAQELYRMTRPYGGVAIVVHADGIARQVEDWLSAGTIPQEERSRIVAGTRIERGELTGAGEWTHQYGDPGRSNASAERLARLPFEVLWYGGIGPAKMVSRHMRMPAPLVVDGRCFVTGTDHLIAMNIYNGRILWEREWPDVAHWPASHRAPSVVVDRRAVYVLDGVDCLMLDPKSGKTIRTYKAPVDSMEPDERTEETIWEYVAVTDRYIVGTFGEPHVVRLWWSRAYPENRVLFVLDRETGEPVWVHRPREGVDPNSIAVADGRLFFIDGRPRYGFLLEQREISEGPRYLTAMDMESGEVLWETEGIAPTQNSLWFHDGVLLATINPVSRSPQDDPVTKEANDDVTAYDAATGERLWHRGLERSCMPVLLEGMAILVREWVVEIRTGEPVQENFRPGFASQCAIFVGSPSLLMARSGSLAFYDLEKRTGYYRYPVVRASCWINMIPAGGLVVVPEGSSSCVCAYNYKTSMAFIHAESD